MLSPLDLEDTKTPTAARPPSSQEPSPWRGFLEGAKRDWIGGWAQDLEDPKRRLVMRIFDDGVPLGEVIADQFRPDLLAAGIGDGHHAFALVVPGGLSPEHRHSIEVRRADDGRLLTGSPANLDASPTLLFRAANLSATPAPWRGQIEIVSRARLEGWAWDQRTPHVPMALVVLVNGEVVARVLANRYRKDLLKAGIGDGRHAFALHIPGGLSPLSRHVIQVVGEADGCEMPSSPVVLEAATNFDGTLEQVLSSSLAALHTPAQRERALKFLVQETEKLLQQNADADSARESRMIQRQIERRLGKARHQGEIDVAVVPGLAARRALVIDDYLPMADHDAGAVAVISHMRALQGLGFEVSFVAAEELAPATQAAAQARTALEASGIHCCVSPYYVSVEEVLRRQKDSFDLVYLHRVSNAQKYLALARHHARRARILYSVADLHHLRLERQGQAESRPELLARSRQARLAEAVAAGSADVVVTHSYSEAQWLRQTVKGANVHVVKWSVPMRAVQTPWSQRTGLAFIGNFAFAPNVDAARVLSGTIMPLVWREDPSIPCLLVGSRMPSDIAQLATDKILVLGHVPDLASVFERVRVTAAPLRFGAGIKGKVLESLAAGMPCVMSPVAAEGLKLPAALATVANTPEEFARLILALHREEGRSAQYAAAAHSFMREGFTEEAVREQLKLAIEGRSVLDAAPPALKHLGIEK
jgi:glycosyltransferase involved in cell wall biosynthesis